ncbi:MAG: hypothetical protein GY935_12540 [Gammaproteobacteria bacterium]|nr:hypothetical protein [Gammaproteobacteria bacterium]
MNSEQKPNITPAPNGPYIVKAVNKCANKNGSMETRETMALCRCGASGNKPFCDGTHAKIGFSSGKLEGRLKDVKVRYEGREITLHDNRSICAHAGYCTDNLATVFKMKEEPWIDPDAASVEEIIATIRNCPSGALSYSLDGSENHPADGESAILIAPNGPYVVSGGIELSNSLGARSIHR